MKTCFNETNFKCFKGLQNKMDINKIITFSVIYIILIANIVYTLPTFGDEFVHIKVHIPSEPSSSKGILGVKPPIVHHKPALTSHKVIHHYHRRRKPAKKVPIEEYTPTLENFYLSELDKRPVTYSHHNDHGHQHTEETFVVKELHDHHYHQLEKPKAEINTYKIIKEYDDDYELNHKEQGKAPIESVKFIETLDNQRQHLYHQSEKPSIETVKLIESFDGRNHPHHYYQTGQHNPLKEYGQTAIETTQLIATTDNHHHQQHYYDHNEYSSHIRDKEILNVIQAPKSNKQSDHYVHYEKPSEEEHIYHKPQADALDIVKTIATIPKEYYKNYETKDHYLVPELIEETLDIFATKKAKNHNYQAPETTSHHYHETPSTNYEYKPKQEISIDEHIEYERPQSYTQTNYPHITPVAEQIPHHYSSAARTYDSTHSVHTTTLDNRKYLPSSETPSNFVQSQGTYQTSISGDVQPADINAKEDLSHAVENPNGPETYTGYDSYSAAHVQGVNSGAYSQRSP